MRNYRVVISIANVDHQAPEHAEVQLGLYNAESIVPLLAIASKLGPQFSQESPVEQHERLVAAQNKVVNDADIDPDELADDLAGS